MSLTRYSTLATRSVFPIRTKTAIPFPPPRSHQPQFHNATMLSSSSSSAGTPSQTARAARTAEQDSGKVHFPTDATLPGERFEVRQTHAHGGDYQPDPAQSLPLSPARQALLDDIIALYEMRPTVERVRRYTPDCVYNDQFVYANDRYKMAAQWFALPKLFAGAKSHGYQVVTNDRDLIQFRHEEEWTFKLIPKTAVVNAIVSLSLDPASLDSDFIRVKYHKDQANEKDYSNNGFGAFIKKWQADNVPKIMSAPELKPFEADKDAGKEKRREYGSGDTKGDAPVKDL